MSQRAAVTAASFVLPVLLARGMVPVRDSISNENDRLVPSVLTYASGRGYPLKFRALAPRKVASPSPHASRISWLLSPRLCGPPGLSDFEKTLSMKWPNSWLMTVSSYAPSTPT